MTTPTTAAATTPSITGALRRAVAFVWDAVSGILREFVWDSLREGAIRLRGLSPATVAVVAVSAALLVAATVSFAVGDVLRAGRDLLVVPNGTSGRGTLVPTPLVPATFLLVGVGMTLLLAGALHAAIGVRIGVLFLYSTVASAFVALADTFEDISGVAAWPGWILVAAVPAVFVVRWRSEPRPAIEFAVLLALVGGTLALSAAGLFRADQISGNAFAVQQLALILGLLGALTGPLLFLAGLDIIGFGLDASTWVLRFIDRRVAQWAVYAGLGLLTVWRVRDVGVQLASQIGDVGAADALAPVLGAAFLVGALWSYWWVAGRVAGSAPGTTEGEDTVEHSSARLRLPLGLAYSGVTLLLVPALLLLQALSYVGVADDAAVFDGLASVSDFLARDGVVTAYRVALGLVLVAVGLRVAARGNKPLAMFLGSIGLSDLFGHLFAEVSPLNSLLWTDEAPLDFVWVAVIAGAAAWWLMRRRLTEVRAERLFFLVLLSELLSQFEFVADPLAPLLGFAGVGFVVFGFVWGFLTGGGWTNDGSSSFPRPSRVYLYLGYSLFSIALLNWFAASHDVGEMTGIEAIGENGVRLLGYPLLYALFTLVLAGAAVDRPIDAEEEDGKADGQADEPELEVLGL